MGKKNDKKTLIILLVVLALAIIGGGIWTYKSLQPLNVPVNTFSNQQIDEVFKMKEESIQNIQDFLDLDFAPGTIWSDFYSDPQFHNLEDIDTEIDINKNIGNPTPFTEATSTTAKKESE